MKRAVPLAVLALACSPASPRSPVTEAPPPASAPLPAPPPMVLDVPVSAPFASSPPCADDASCGWARCNRAEGRCAFPCFGDDSCAEGARCLPAPGNEQIQVCQAPIDGP